MKYLFCENTLSNHNVWKLQFGLMNSVFPFINLLIGIMFSSKFWWNSFCKQTRKHPLYICQFKISPNCWSSILHGASATTLDHYLWGPIEPSPKLEDISNQDQLFQRSVQNFNHSPIRLQLDPLQLNFLWEIGRHSWGAKKWLCSLWYNNMFYSREMVYMAYCFPLCQNLENHV